MFKGKDAGGNVWDYFQLQVNNSDTYLYKYSTNVLNDPWCSFAIHTEDDRSKIVASARYRQDRHNDSWSVDQTAKLDLNSFDVEISNEFIIHVYHEHFHGAVAQDVYTLLQNFDYRSRESFAGINDDPGTPLHEGQPTPKRGGANDPISILFRTVTEAIVNALEDLATLLKPFFDAIETAVNAIEGWLTTLGTTITDAIGDIQGWVEALPDAIGTALEFISDAIGIIVEDFFDWLWGVAAELGEFLADVVAILLPLLNDLAEYIIGFVAAVIFWLWDSLGLPDLLAVIDVFLTGFIQFISGIPQFITDWADFLSVIANLLVAIGLIWILFFPVAQANTAGECLGLIVDHMMTDLSGHWTILGIGGKMPLIIPWILLFIWTYLTDTVFFGFFG